MAFSDAIEEVINPKITWKSDELELNYEGCLSLPGLIGPVERPAQVQVEYYKACGSKKETMLSGHTACIFQVIFLCLRQTNAPILLSLALGKSA